MSNRGILVSGAFCYGEKMEKKTAGQIALELQAQNDGKQSVVDTQREMDKEYLNEIKKCIDNHSHFVEPFYIVVLVKQEKVLKNVMRRFFLARISLPTPHWDQQVWRYDPRSGDLEFLWTLPSKETAHLLLSEASNLSLEFTQLLDFVRDFKNGKLYDKFLSKEKNMEIIGQEEIYKDQMDFVKETQKEAIDETSSDVKHGGTIIH